MYDLVAFVYYLQHLIWCEIGHKQLASLTKGMVLLDICWTLYKLPFIHLLSDIVSSVKDKVLNKEQIKSLAEDMTETRDMYFHILVCYALTELAYILLDIMALSLINRITASYIHYNTFAAFEIFGSDFDERSDPLKLVFPHFAQMSFKFKCC